jgi:hypothetical protein
MSRRWVESDRRGALYSESGGVYQLGSSVRQGGPSGRDLWSTPPGANKNVAKKKTDASAAASKAKPAPPKAAKAKATKPKAAKAATAGVGDDGAPVPVAPKPTAKKSAPKPKAEAAPKRAFSTEEIGHVAGDVWHVLSTEGTKTAAELTKAVAAPAELVAAALGWLAREDKLAFETNGRSVSVSLV